MAYAVKSIFYTLQGEGYHTGRPAVFCRFSGCNLWNGRERDRKRAICAFCDTDFVGIDGPGGGRFETPERLADAIASRWPERGANKFVVCTGGEPLLQLNAALIEALHGNGFEIAVESNGTIAAPDGIDWLCISPKAAAPLVQRSGDEIKLVYPQAENHPDQFVRLNFRHRFLQPLDDAAMERNAAAAVRFCQTDPRWRLSVQTHKILGIP